MKTILAPIDFSAVSKAVVDAAAELARVFNGRLVLLNVVQPVVVNDGFGYIDVYADAIKEAADKYADDRLIEFETLLSSFAIPYQVLKRNGPAIGTILDQAIDLRADYIVIGSHGHTALYELLVGSTTHGVLMRAKCPVVIVPASRVAPQNEKTLRDRVMA